VTSFSGAGLRDMLAEGMLPAVKATVALHEGETSHFETNPDGDIEVTVVAHHGQVPITAILCSGAGGGVWKVPPLGAEVFVVFDGGDFEADAFLVGTAPARGGRGGATPAGVTDTRTVIASDEVRATADLIELASADVRVGNAPGPPHSPTFRADFFLAAFDTLIAAIATAAAGTGPAVTSAINAANVAFHTDLDTTNGYTTATKVQ
jgi:hypothetical protein